MDNTTNSESAQRFTYNINRYATPNWIQYKRMRGDSVRNQAVSTLLRLADTESSCAKTFSGYWKQWQGLHDLKLGFASMGLDWPSTVWVPAELETPTVWGRYHNILHHLATWQQTRGVYQFEPEIWEALQDSDLGGAPLPIDVLERLPQHSVYLDFQGRAGNHLGAYVMLDYRYTNQKMGLAIMHDTIQDDQIIHVATNLSFIKGKSLQQTLSSARQAAWNAMLRGESDAHAMYCAALRDPIANNPESVALVIKLALYLCSSNSEIDALKDKTKPPLPVQKMKKGPRQSPDPKIRVFKVGQEIARELREVKARAKQTEKEETERTGRKPVTPHIRRAHFRTFLLGPRTGEQTREVRWLPPTNVSPRVSAIPHE